MHKLVAALALSLCLVFALAASSSAAVVVYYSKADNTYGWCANGSYTYCEQTAEDSCVNAGGKDCGYVLECSGGWGAMAFAEGDVSGFGASCHTGDASSARDMALTACITASNAFCSTNDTFSLSGRQSSVSSNLAYDQTFYTQIMLDRMNLYPYLTDGIMGTNTRAAVKQFQSSIGVDPTGIVDANLIELLTYAVQGGQRAIDAIISSASGDPAMLAKYTYGYAITPLPKVTFSTQLAAMSDDKRRLALAINVAATDWKCTLPAVQVEAVNVEDGAWNVDCVEGPYFVLFSEAGRVVSAGHGTVETKPSLPATPVPPHQPTSPAGVAAPVWTVPGNPSGTRSAPMSGGARGR